MEQTRFVIESADVRSVAEESGLSLLQLLTSLVKSTQTLASPPISKYHVGAVGLGSDSRIFLGVNLEFPGLPLHHSIHTEQFLITNAAIHGSTQLRYITILSVQCGHCRQYIQEIHGASNMFSMSTHENSAHVLLTPDHLPTRTLPTSRSYRPKTRETTMKTQRFGFPAPEIRSRQYAGQGCAIISGAPSQQSLEVANKSHAPYRGCPSRVALKDTEGKVYKGSYVESAAYNSNLGPVQAVVVDARRSWQGRWWRRKEKWWYSQAEHDCYYNHDVIL
uniref:CMP/dCMP-type deaminase domain-containing protein n=1 Tax=Nelumbo nucifera TaxID=4432 RepID=A0A822Z0Y6_NELNU|nr:TPA_asm: hypothetical protein HUJ06_009031 [Nelumbo nucifera]